MKQIIPYQFIKFQKNNFVNYYNKIRNANGIVCFDFEDSIKAEKTENTFSLKKENQINFLKLIHNNTQLIDYNYLGIRINSNDSIFFTNDIDLLKTIKPEFNCIFIPKINNIKSLEEYFLLLKSIKCKEIIPIIETDEGFKNMESIVRFKNERFKKIAFGHCDYNLSISNFPFIHQTNNKYWEWINEFKTKTSGTDILFINSPFLNLNAEGYFNETLARLDKTFNSFGQITLCLAQTECCAKYNSHSNLLIAFNDIETKPKIEVAMEIIQNYEVNKFDNKSFAILKNKRILISPHEYSLAQKIVNETKL